MTAEKIDRLIEKGFNIFQILNISKIIECEEEILETTKIIDNALMQLWHGVKDGKSVSVELMSQKIYKWNEWKV